MWSSYSCNCLGYKCKSYRAHAIFARSAYDFCLTYDRRSIFCPKIIIKNRAVTARSSQRLHTAPTRLVYDLKTKCRLLQIVEATENRKDIAGSPCGDRMKMLKLALYDHRKLIAGQMLPRHISSNFVTK